MRRIGIVGLGLIGASVALAARRAWPTVWIGGVERDEWPRDRHRGLVDAFCTTRDLVDVDLIVLAAPVAANIQRLGELAETRRPLLVTDVGGTKGAMLNAATLLDGSLIFVGGHPMAGAELSGPAHARADLFDGHPWFVVPGPRTADEDLQRVETCVRMLGAKPVCIDADTHDRLMALISHVPQIVASVLMQVVGERARADGLAFAGRGLVDTTRLAAASSEWLASVIDTNADHIGAALDDVIAQLQKIRTEIGEGRSVEDLFEQASTWREVLLDRRRAME